MYKGEEAHDPLRNAHIAQAIILKRWETNIVFNGNPQIGLLLEVRPAGRPVFQAEVKTVVARFRLAQLQPGAELTVSYNPAIPARVAIAALPDAASE